MSTTLTVTFDDDARIGRTHYVDPLVVDADDDIDWDAVAEAIYRYARKYLASRDVEVVIANGGDPADRFDVVTGNVFCGFQVGARFTITADG